MGHIKSIEHVNREHARRNHREGGNRMIHGESEGGHGRSTTSVAGSNKVHEDTPHTKSRSMGGSSDAKALGRVSGGRPDTAKGKNVR